MHATARRVSFEPMQTALEAIHEYYDAFSTLDLRAIVSHFCEPSMTVTPSGVLSAPNHTALAESLAPLVDGLRAKAYGPRLSHVSERGWLEDCGTCGCELTIELL